jgi:hypothetical protein
VIIVEVDQRSEAALRIRFEKIRERSSLGLSKGIEKAAIHLSTIIKRDYLSGQMVKNRKGHLRRSIFARMLEKFTGAVGIGKEVPYGKFVHEGTRPHMIYPKNKKALAFAPAAGAIRASAFVPKGKLGATLRANMIVRKGVKHPGTAPKPFLRIGLISASSEIRQIISDAVMKEIK